MTTYAALIWSVGVNLIVVIEEAAAMAVLQPLFRDRGNSSMEIIKICSNDKPIEVEPRLVMSGSLSSLHPIYIAAERMIVCRLCNTGLATALSLLVGSYYIFDMEYPSCSRNIFLYIETVLMDNCNNSKKRIVGRCNHAVWSSISPSN